ncbi:MAG: SulP family inorganic anion transporter [Bacteroidales bacterium]|nr:SulP family inorganic anion transporter [Bacteroidales bacterium]
MKGFEFKPSLVTSLKGYNKKTFMADFMAGIIVGIVALPLAIAFGIASGVTPEQGIITAIVAGFIISVFGGSKVQIGGPTGAFIVIIAGIINEYGIEGLAIATVLAGVFLVALGLLRLGTIIKYIPYPIVVGFTSGIALTIFTTQIKDLFGLTIEGGVPADFISKWVVYCQNFGSIDLWSAVVGIVSFIIIVITPKFSKVIPGSLIAIILMTVGVVILKNYGLAEHVDTIGDRFTINSTLPDPNVPDMNWETIKSLISPAITIAVLGAIESLLSATVADGVIGDKTNSNQELIGQGIANILSPIFGGIPATGAIARTMTNINNGGKTPIAGIIHAVVLLLIFLLLMPLAQYIPMSCLAGVLVVVAYNMSGWRTFKGLLSNPKSDISVLLITFFLTVIFDLTVAIEVGLLLACLLCMRRMAETTQVSVLTDEIDPNQETDMQVASEEHLVIPERCEVYEINGPYFFGIANKFDEVMEHHRSKHRPLVRIIRMRKVPFMDSTGIHNLSCLIQTCHDQGIHVILSGVNPQVHQVLEKSHFYEIMNSDHICPHINVALETAREYLASLK